MNNKKSNTYHHSLDTDVQDLKRMREKITLELRKKKKNAEIKLKRKQILKKYKNQLQSQKEKVSNEQKEIDEFNKLKDYIDELLVKKFEYSDLKEIVKKIKSKNRFDQHYGVIGARKLLSNQGAPIQEIIDANIVFTLIEFMQTDQEPHLQLESTWAITNIASGTHQQVQSLIEKDIIPTLVNIVTHDVTDIAEQALWGIGNISGDQTSFRDKLIEYGAVTSILELLDRISSDNFELMKVLTWVLSNLCRGKPLPKIESVKLTIPFFSLVIQKFNDTDMLQDSLWAMSYLSDGDENLVDSVLETDILTGLIKHLDPSKQMSILMPSLRIIGNIVTGTEEQTQKVIDVEIIPKLFVLLNHEKVTVRKECCWILSNITAGSSKQIAKVFSNIQQYKKLAILCIEDNEEIQREATWAIANATSHAQPPQIKSLVDAEVIKIFVMKLDSQDNKTLSIILEALRNVLECGAKHFEQNDQNPFLSQFEELGGQEKVESLQTHPNHQVYEKSFKLLDQFYEFENEI